MSNFVIPDQVHLIPIQNGVLRLSPSYDILHHWEENNAWMLKYWNTDVQPPTFCNIPLGQEQADFLIQACGIEVCERKRMGEQEFQHYVGWLGTQGAIDHLDFEPELGDEEA
jgi:hypothetical protein